MLTPEALNQRKWGEFPVLRRILESKPVPGEYYGHTSVSANIFTKLQDLAEVAIIVRENRENILEGATPENIVQFTQDLQRLETAMGFGAHFFQEHARLFREFAAEVYHCNEPRQKNFGTTKKD